MTERMCMSGAGSSDGNREGNAAVMDVRGGRWQTATVGSGDRKRLRGGKNGRGVQIEYWRLGLPVQEGWRALVPSPDGRDEA